MSSAREIINAACHYVNQWHNSTYASKVAADLESAGFRILTPDELDPKTVERCAHTAWLHATQGATPSQIAYELRTLTGGNNGR